MNLKRLNESNNRRHLSDKEWKEFDKIVKKFAIAYKALTDLDNAVMKANFLKDQKDTYNNNIYDELRDITGDFVQWDLVGESLATYSGDERGVEIADEIYPS